MMRPAWRAGPSMAARSSSGDIAASTYRPRSTRRASAGCAETSPIRSARRTRTSGAASAWSASSWTNRSRSAWSWHREKSSSAWSTTSGRGLPLGPGRGQGADGVPAWGDVRRSAAPRGRSVATMPARTSDDFPLPDGPRTARTPSCLETLEAESDVAVAAEEALVVVDVVGHEAQVGAGVAGPLPGFGGVEVGVLAEDGLLEFSEAGAGVDAELVDEAAPDSGDGAQGFALPAGAVLGQGQQLPPALPQWSGVGQCLGLGEDLAVVAGLDGGFEPPFLGVEAELGQAGRLEAAGLPLLELGVRASAPQGERLSFGTASSIRSVPLDPASTQGTHPGDRRVSVLTRGGFRRRTPRRRCGSRRRAWRRCSRGGERPSSRSAPTPAAIWALRCWAMRQHLGA